MISASEYRKRVRKVVVLPSGGEVEIRKLTASDFLGVGEIPLAFQTAIRSGDRAAAESVMLSNPGLAKRMNAAILANGVLSMKVVDKPPRECAEDEIAVSEIAQEDQVFLLDAISSFNFLKTEDGKSASRFPEESGASGVD